MRKQTDDEEKSQQNLCTPVFKSPNECYSIKSVDRAHTEYVCRINAVKHEAHRLACQFACEFDLLRISIALPLFSSAAKKIVCATAAKFLESNKNGKHEIQLNGNGCQCVVRQTSTFIQIFCVQL